MKLSIKKIESSKPLDKPYKLADGGGLHLYITPTGTKTWRLKYRFLGKEKLLTIGQYPYISLSQARTERETAKEILASGRDPSFEKKSTKISLSVDSENTFQQIATEWAESKKPSWSKKYYNGVTSILSKDIFPYIGYRPVNSIKPLELLNVLRQIESRGAYEVANKARMRCNEIFGYAVITGRSENNPARELAPAMIRKEKQNYPFLSEPEMSDFLHELNGYSGNIVIRMATLFLILSAARTIEMRSLKWSYIDFENKLITIPAEIMKKSRAHLIPMSDQIIKVLEFMRPISGHYDYVFIGRNDHNKPISDGAILGLIKRIGFANRASGHGFRHQFSTVLNENGFDRDWIEKQLAHEEGSVRGIYNHAQYLNGRREMMQWYSDYIDKLS